MKKIITYSLIVLMILVNAVGIFAPRQAEASCGPLFAVTAYVNGGTNSLVLDCANELANLIVVPVVGKFLQISGYLFGKALAINLTMSQMVNSNSTTLSPIESIWKIVRDLSNLVFIFVLLAASVKLILGLGGDIKKLVGSIIIAGLMMNFSLFITKLAVDASNTVSIAIYNAITPGEAAPNTSIGLDANDGGISYKFMSVMNLQTLFASASKNASASDYALKSLIIVVGGSALMVVAGISFLAGAIMFLYRFVMLIFLLSFSPLPWLGMILPNIKEYSDKWTKNLASMCMFAPVYLLFIYIALSIFTNPITMNMFMGSNGSGNTLAESFLGTTIGPILQYAITIMIMVFGLSAAGKYGGVGADLGIKWINNAKKWGLSYAGRNTIGRASGFAGKVYDKLDKVEIKPGPRGAVLLNTLDNVTHGAASAVAKSVSKTVSGVTTDARMSIKATLDSGAKGKYGGSQSSADIIKARKTFENNLARENKISGDKKELMELVEKEVLTKDETKTIKDTLSKLSSKEIEGLGSSLSKPNIATNLTSKNIENIMKSSDISEVDKDKIREARAEGLSKIAETIKSSDWESIMKEELSNEQKSKISDAREKSLSDMVKEAVSNGDTTKLKGIIRNFGGKELAKIGEKKGPNDNDNPINKGELVGLLGESQLKEMADMNQELKNKIGFYIDSMGNGGTPGYGYIMKNKESWGLR